MAISSGPAQPPQDGDKVALTMERLGELMESPDERVATVACNAILDRAFGKPQPHREQEPDEFDDMNAEQLRAYLIQKLMGHGYDGGARETVGPTEQAET